MGTFEGKIALITGAGGRRGIGRATALELARRGADLVLTDVTHAEQDLPPDEAGTEWRGIESVAAEIEPLGRRCLTVHCDLTDREQIDSLFRQSVDHFGRLDVLINNSRALIGRDRAPVFELDDAVWDRFFAINSTAAYLCTKHAARRMIAQGGGGRILNVGSDCSKVGRRNQAAYCASKFALIGLTQASAADLAPHGITVNAVCPGPVNTNRLNYWEREQARQRGVSLDEVRNEVRARTAEQIPLGRIAEPEEVASLLVYLASDEAGYITGQAYNVNGGQLYH